MLTRWLRVGDCGELGSWSVVPWVPLLSTRYGPHHNTYASDDELEDHCEGGINDDKDLCMARVIKSSNYCEKIRMDRSKVLRPFGTVVSCQSTVDYS